MGQWKFYISELMTKTAIRNFSGKFLPGKPKFWGELPGEIGIFCKFPWKNKFFTRIHDPQIPNQIDAADIINIT